LPQNVSANFPAKGQPIMSGVETMYLWLIYNPLTAAALFFGGAALAVILYTFVHDYHMLGNRPRSI
jgi:hypothetical protein